MTEPTRYDAFLTRLALRIFSDSPGLASYLDGTYVAGKSVWVVFHDLPPEVVPKVVPLFAVADVEGYRYVKDQVAKVAFKVTPTEADMADLEAYPLEPDDDKPASDDPDRVPAETGQPGSGAVVGSPVS